MSELILSTKYIARDILLDGGKRIEYLRKLKLAGFSSLHFDFNNFYFNELLNEKCIVEIFKDVLKNGFEVKSSHIYVNPYENIWSENQFSRERLIWEIIYKCLYYNKLFDISDTVYHVPETDDFNIRKCQKFISQIPYLIEQSLKCKSIICLENHYNQKIDNFIFKYLFEKYDKNELLMTFDVGHYFISKNIRIIDENFYNRLQIVHLHDNNGVEDQHRIPNFDEKREFWDMLFNKLNEIKRMNKRVSIVFEILKNNGIQKYDSLQDIEMTYTALKSIYDFYLNLA